MAAYVHTKTVGTQINGSQHVSYPLSVSIDEFIGAFIIALIVAFTGTSFATAQTVRCCSVVCLNVQRLK
jgi:hypothetical protein